MCPSLSMWSGWIPAWRSIGSLPCRFPPMVTGRFYSPSYFPLARPAADSFDFEATFRFRPSAFDSMESASPHNRSPIDSFSPLMLRYHPLSRAAQSCSTETCVYRLSLMMRTLKGPPEGWRRSCPRPEGRVYYASRQTAEAVSLETTSRRDPKLDQFVNSFSSKEL